MSERTGGHLTTRSSMRYVLSHPAFRGFGDQLLPWDDGAYDENMPLSQIGSLLPYHSHVDPETVTSALNRELRSQPAALAEARLPAARRPPAKQLAFVAWSMVHGAAMLWLDGPLRCGVPKAEARARFEAGLEFMFRSGRASFAAERAAPERPLTERRAEAAPRTSNET